MVSKAEKQQIRDYAAAGKSVNWIKDELEIPKSTVYYHFRKEVGQKQKENQPEIPDDPDFRGELCGIFAGDGNYRKAKRHCYKTRFTLNKKQNYWRKLKDYLKERTGRAPHIHKRPNANTVDLLYGFKKFVELYREHLFWNQDKTASISLKDEKNYSEEFKIGFLRGLIDTDGSLNNRRFIFTSISQNLTEDTRDILDELNIRHKIGEYEDKRPNCRTVYHVKTARQDSKTFFDLIRPRHPRKQLEDAASGI